MSSCRGEKLLVWSMPWASCDVIQPLKTNFILSKMRKILAMNLTPMNRSRLAERFRILLRSDNQVQRERLVFPPRHVVDRHAVVFTEVLWWIFAHEVDAFRGYP